MSVLSVTLEEYLAGQGYPHLGHAEPAMHRQPRSDEKLRDKRSATALLSATEYDEMRRQLSEKYNRLVEAGEIIPPTRIERLRRAAAGHPDNESTQAAKRLLAKLADNR